MMNQRASIFATLLLTFAVCSPALATFKATASNMSTTRYNHTSTLLANGKVLIAGGQTGRETRATSIPRRSTIPSRAGSLRPGA